jgi:hypothetical protein
LSCYWGVLDYQLGASTGEIGVGPLLGTLGFSIGAWAHRGGFLRTSFAGRPVDPAPLEESAAFPQRVSPPTDRALDGGSDSEIIDAEYHGVS